MKTDACRIASGYQVGGLLVTSRGVKLETIIDIPCLLTGVWSRFGVHLFYGHASTADMDAMEAAGDRWLADNPGRTVELVVIFPSRARMTTAERMRMARLLKKRERFRDASATVILAQGLTGAVHRSVLTGLLMLAPPPHPARIFAATHDAVTWLRPYVQSLCGAEATTPALTAAVDELCARFSTRLDAAVRQ